LRYIMAVMRSHALAALLVTAAGCATELDVKDHSGSDYDFQWSGLFLGLGFDF